MNMKRTTDNKQNLMKLTRYNKKRFDGCEVILGLSHKDQMMILDLVFHNELYNDTTNPLFSRHYECIENDEKYREKVRENYFPNSLYDFQLHPLLRSDLFSSMKQLILNGGGGKFRKKINTILEQYELGEYNV
jgi:DNA-binding FadR family transcriptional regulator